MSTSISLDYKLSPPATCRVENQPLTLPDGFHRISKGNQVYTDPSTGIVKRQYGMTVSDWTGGLPRLVQRGPHLRPEYNNGGCTSLYCKDGTVCPLSKKAVTSDSTNAMFDYLFTPQCDFTGNNAPPQCFVGKCADYNSTLGWQVANNKGQLQWQVNNNNNTKENPTINSNRK